MMNAIRLNHCIFIVLLFLLFLSGCNSSGTSIVFMEEPSQTSTYDTGATAGGVSEIEPPRPSVMTADSGREIVISPLVKVDKYPTIEAVDQIVVQQEFAVLFSLTEDLITPEVVVNSTNSDIASVTDDGKLSLAMPSGDSWPLNVVISAPGMEYLSSNQATLTLPRHGDSMPVLFSLRPKSISVPSRATKIYITLWYKGTYLAKVVREITIVQDNLVETPVRSNVSMPAQTHSSPPVSLDMVSRPADLTVFIMESLDPERPHETQVIINSPYLQPSSQTHYSQSDQDTWLQQRFGLFASRVPRGFDVVTPQDNPKAVGTQALLDGFGRELYRKFAPPVFKEAYWNLVARLGPQFKTIQIYSNNPRIPWELMRPSKNGSGEHDFLGVNYQIGRWHVSENFQQLDRPPQIVPLTGVSVIAPKYEGESYLTFQRDEVNNLRMFENFQEVGGDMTALQRFFTTLPGGIIHFSGHGKVQQDQQGFQSYAILLENSQSLDVDVWKGLLPAQVKNHPFFFLNACEVGQSGRVSNVVNGWAPSVLDAGASGYVGALWSVGDRGARDVSKEFYEQVRKGMFQPAGVEVATILQNIRQKFKQTGDPTYLAYIFYGDPGLAFTQ